MSLSSCRARFTPSALLAVNIFIVAASSSAQSLQIESLERGETKDLYFQINVAGKVHVKLIAPAGGDPCANFWWIKWPFGNVEQLGRQCSFASFDIPGLSHGAVSSKLRIGGSENDLRLGVAADETVARSWTFEF